MTTGPLAGTRLGPYEVLSPLGAGGMGEVYKARDTRLDRIVAIKVMAAALTGSPELRARFDREARAISALNHPHICALFDVGHQDGIDFQVMEYLEGQTLSDRIAKGALPMTECLRYAIEIASALDTAHRGAIVHRDVKPANVFLTVSGSKLLDFGLAKTGAAVVVGKLSMLPTTPPRTVEGTILGTFQYMAPEQLEGIEADARADIFAFGAVVYEMVTGKQPFSGTSQASLISAIMSADPRPIAASVPGAPPALDHLIMTCLAKNRDVRWQSAGDIVRALEWIAGAASSVDAGARTPVHMRSHRGRWAWGLVAVVTVVLGLASLAVRAQRVAPAIVSWFSVSPPENGLFGHGAGGPMVTVSPDGRTLAFVAAVAGGPEMIWLRSLDSLSARAVPGTEGASSPFWSPDSQSVGFFTAAKLKAAGLNGKEPRTICDVLGGFQGTWGRAGAILFVASLRGARGLSRVPEFGGVVTAETTPELSTGETGHLLPSFLPDGQHYLFDVIAADGVSVTLGSLGSKARRRLLNISEMSAASTVLFVPPGHLLFVRDGTLLALPFDLSRYERVGDARPVVEGVQSIGAGGGASSFSVSSNGVLAYWRGAIPATGRLTWFTRDGRETRTSLPASNYGRISLAPNGEAVAADAQGLGAGASAVWLLDLLRGTTTRLTNDAFSIWPIWSPDGGSIIFSSTRALGRLAPYRQSLAAGGDAQRLFDPGAAVVVTDWSVDGQTVVYETDRPRGHIGVFSLKGGSPPRPFLHTDEGQSDGRLSPDGRWMAYVSNEKGGEGVYVTAFPDAGRRWSVSAHGGNQPQWRADGKELYFRTWDGKVMAATIRTQGTFEASAPVTVLDLPSKAYTAARDGSRFLLVLPVSEAISPPITVLTDWTTTLKE